MSGMRCQVMPGHHSSADGPPTKKWKVSYWLGVGGWVGGIGPGLEPFGGGSGGKFVKARCMIKTQIKTNETPISSIPKERRQRIS